MLHEMKRPLVGVGRGPPPARLQCGLAGGEGASYLFMDRGLRCRCCDDEEDEVLWQQPHHDGVPAAGNLLPAPLRRRRGGVARAQQEPEAASRAEKAAVCEARSASLASILPTLALGPARPFVLASPLHTTDQLIEGRRSRQTIVRSDSSRFLTPGGSQRCAPVLCSVRLRAVWHPLCRHTSS